MTTKRYSARKLPIDVPVTGLRGDTLRSPLYRHKTPAGLVRDLTGCTIVASATLSDGTAVDLTEHLLVDLVNGIYRLSIPVSVTNGATPWPAGLGSYRITVTDPLGVAITYYAGSIGLKEGNQS